MIEDIVCGSMLSEDGPTYTSQYHGQTYDFCSLRCKNRFELSPEEFQPLGESAAISQTISGRWPVN